MTTGNSAVQWQRLHRFLLEMPVLCSIMALEEESCVSLPVVESSSRSWRRRSGCGSRHLTSSLAAAHAGLQAVLVAGSTLEGFEGIREAVAKHGHLAAMAHWTRDESKAPAGLARLGLLYPLEDQQIYFIDNPKTLTCSLFDKVRKQVMNYYFRRGCEQNSQTRTLLALWCGFSLLHLFAKKVLWAPMLQRTTKKCIFLLIERGWSETQNPAVLFVSFTGQRGLDLAQVKVTLTLLSLTFPRCPAFWQDQHRDWAQKQKHKQSLREDQQNSTPTFWVWKPTTIFVSESEGLLETSFLSVIWKDRMSYLLFKLWPPPQ